MDRMKLIYQFLFFKCEVFDFHIVAIINFLTRRDSNLRSCYFDLSLTCFLISAVPCWIMNISLQYQMPVVLLLPLCSNMHHFQVVLETEGLLTDRAHILIRYLVKTFLGKEIDVLNLLS